MNAAAALGRHLNVRIQVRSFEAVCRMVGSGVGLGLVPRSALRTGELSEPPSIVELDESWAQRDLQICVRRRTALSDLLPPCSSTRCWRRARVQAPLKQQAPDTAGSTPGLGGLRDKTDLADARTPGSAIVSAMIS